MGLSGYVTYKFKMTRCISLHSPCHVRYRAGSVPSSHPEHRRLSDWTTCHESPLNAGITAPQFSRELKQVNYSVDLDFAELCSTHGPIGDGDQRLGYTVIKIHCPHGGPAGQLAALIEKGQGTVKTKTSQLCITYIRTDKHRLCGSKKPRQTSIDEVCASQAPILPAD